MVRWLLRIARSVAIAYLILLGVMMFFEDSFVFFPPKYPEGNWQPHGLRFEDARFQSADGTRLHGWYVPCENPRAVVLLCHGNGGNVTHYADMLATLHNMGVAVLAFDYRGYGRSEGKPSEAGVVADARAASEWLAQREGAKPDELVLMGHSLGGAVAVELAATRGARGLVVLSSFNNLPDVAAYHYPWLPVRWVMRNRFDAAGKIAAYRSPLLQTHSEIDSVVPYQNGRKLFEAANEPKTFVTLPPVDHNDPQPAEVYAALRDFLDKLPAG